MAESAKAKAAASVPDKQRRHAQSTTVVKPAEGVARRSKLYTSDVNYVVSSTSLTISLTILAHLYYYTYYTNYTYYTYYTSPPFSSLVFHFYYSLAARRGHSPTSTSHGHRFDSELNRSAAEMGCKGSEEGGNASASGKTVQARLTQRKIDLITSMHRPHVSAPSYRCKWSSRKARPS